MESTNFINPQALSSVLTVLMRYMYSGVYKIHRFHCVLGIEQHSNTGISLALSNNIEVI